MNIDQPKNGDAHTNLTVESSNIEQMVNLAFCSNFAAFYFLQPFLCANAPFYRVASLTPSWNGLSFCCTCFMK